MSDSVRPHRRQPTRLPRPWDSPGKNTGVGCHVLLQYRKVKVKLLSRFRLFETPWTAAYQAPPSMGFSRQEYWSGVPSPSPFRSTDVFNFDKAQLTSFSFVFHVFFLSYLRIHCEIRESEDLLLCMILRVLYFYTPTFRYLIHFA